VLPMRVSFVVSDNRVVVGRSHGLLEQGFCKESEPRVQSGSESGSTDRQLTTDNSWTRPIANRVERDGARKYCTESIYSGSR